MKITQVLTHRLQNPPFYPTDKDFCIIRLSKIGINLLYKSMVAIALVLAMVASPIFQAVGYCSGETHQWESMNIPSIVEFYSGQVNDRGVTLEEIWNWDDSRLESQHDFIQWLFPIPTKGVNPTAPPTNLETIQAFKQDKLLREKMLQSFKVMLAFYGFTLDSSGTIQMGPDFSKKGQNWLNPGNHNYRRVSRILKSLSLHGLETYSTAFFNALQQVYNAHSSQIGAATFQIWRDSSF